MAGVNLVNRGGAEAQALRQWYIGPTLVDLLDLLEPPTRDIMSPLRFPTVHFSVPVDSLKLSAYPSDLV